LPRPTTIEEECHISPGEQSWGKEESDDAPGKAKDDYGDWVRASQVINKRGRGNRWPEATTTDNGFFLSVNFLPLHSPFPLWV
jgi:hypothetical protein